jgi:CheY-like chemotaxis protein
MGIFCSRLPGICLRRKPKSWGANKIAACQETRVHRNGVVFLHYRVQLRRNDRVALPCSSRAQFAPIISFVSVSQQTVLVIDDDPDFAELVASIIEGADCRTIVATDGLTGLRLAREFSPALILCDVSMPGVDGEDVMRSLQEDPTMADVPRVLMSGFGCPDLRRIPADAFIAKPIDTQSLRRLVRAFTRSQNVAIAD